MSAEKLPIQESHIEIPNMPEVGDRLILTEKSLEELLGEELKNFLAEVSPQQLSKENEQLTDAKGKQLEGILVKKIKAGNSIALFDEAGHGGKTSEVEKIYIKVKTGELIIKTKNTFYKLTNEGKGNGNY